MASSRYRNTVCPSCREAVAMAQQHLAPDQMVALRDRICAAVMAQARQLGSAQHMPPCAGVGLYG